MNDQTEPESAEFEDAQEDQHAEEEVEIWTGAYSVRMFLPALIIGIAITAVLFALARFRGAEGDNDFLRYGIEGSLLVGWLVLLGIACYRVLGTEYMLTDRRLYCRRGFGHPGRAALDLGSFLDVRVQQSPLERLLRAGRIVLSVTRGAGSPCVLAGIPDPERVASIFRKQMRAVHSPKQ